MKRRVIILGILIMITGVCALRPSLGRSRPDLAALMSFDDGPLTFARTYTTGQIGPFIIGQSRNAARSRLSGLQLLDQDRAQLADNTPNWRVALPAESGGYNLYTLNFRDNRITSVKAFYSVFAGL